MQYMCFARFRFLRYLWFSMSFFVFFCWFSLRFQVVRPFYIFWKYWRGRAFIVVAVPFQIDFNDVINFFYFKAGFVVYSQFLQFNYDESQSTIRTLGLLLIFLVLTKIF